MPNAPVEIGLVPNLGHPDGNITGVAVNASDMAGKRMQLLKELVPTFRRVAILSHPSHPTNAVQLQEAEAAARTLGVHLKAVPVRSADDFAPALNALRGIEGVLHADTFRVPGPTATSFPPGTTPSTIIRASAC